MAGGDTAERSYAELGNLLCSCGVQESVDKASPPSTIMVFVGVLFTQFI